MAVTILTPTVATLALSPQYPIGVVLGTDHPINQVLVDGVAVSKANYRSYEENYNRLRAPNVAWVQSRDLSDTFGIDISGVMYDKTSTDTTSADDGISVIVDRVGNRFKRRQARYGSTLIDFGVSPGASDASVQINDNGILATSVVEAWISPVATADHSQDEHIVSPIRIYAGNIVAGQGFTVYGINDDREGDVRVYGRWTVNWFWQ